MTMPTTSQGTPATATAAAAASAGLDPTAASIFALPQTLYEQAMASGATTGGAGPPSLSHQSDFSTFLGGMSTLPGSSGGSSAQVGHMDSAGVPFSDSDTLAMWSNAPAGFEYVLFLFFFVIICRSSN